MERQNRLLTVLSVIFLVLVAVVVLTKDKKSSTGGEDGAPPRHDLFDYENDDITKLSLTRAGTTLSFEKLDGRWSMTAPRTLPVDDKRVNEIVERFGSLEVEERTINGKPEDLGLDDAQRADLTLTSSKGKTFAVSLGNDTKVGYATYLREEAGGPVQLATAKVGDLVQRDADDFRSKEVWRLSEYDAHRVKIEAGDRVVVLRKDDHGWWLGDTGPRVDKQAVEDWFGQAQNVRVESFLDGESPATAGVEPPAARITVEGKDGSSTLALGPSGEDGVKAVGSTGVVKLAADAAQLVKLDGWASTKLLLVRPYQVDKVTVQLGAKKLELTRTEGQWKTADGTASPLGDGLLDKLTAAGADWTTPGVPAPTEAWGTITLAEGDTRKEVVHIGQDLGNGTRAAKDEAGGPPFAVPTSELDLIASGLP